MGKITIHKYDKNSGKWLKMDSEKIDKSLDNYNAIDNHLAKKYDIDLSKKSPFETWLLLTNTLKNKGLYYEKILFDLTTNYYFTNEDLIDLKKCFELVNKESPNDYCTGMMCFIEELIELNNKDLIIAFGHSSGGFWATDPDLLDSITVKLSDSVRDKIASNINLVPHKYGNRFDFPR